MARIRKTISGLKPDTNYLFTVKPKNAEVVASDNLTETIRVKVPASDSIPSNVTGLVVASNFQTVILKFDPVNDIDIQYYEYQIYDEPTGTNMPLNNIPSPSTGEIISGTHTANVFTVSVSNSTTEENRQYWARVRAINTSGAPSASWSNLVGSGDLDLIEDQFIASLTAGKITSGEIQSATINMSGANSMIKSTIYDFSDATPVGWFIRGDGQFSLGGSSGITYDTNTGVTIGSGVTIVPNVGLAANAITVGSAPSILRISNDLGGGKAGLAVGSAGYWHTDGDFQLGSSPNYLSWDQSESAITLGGSIDAISGKIGGFSIDQHSLTSITPTGAVGVSSGGVIETIPGLDDVAFFAGKDGVSNTPPFRVYTDGRVIMGGGGVEVLTNGNMTTSGSLTVAGNMSSTANITANGNIYAKLLQSHTTVPQPSGSSWKLDGTGFQAWSGTTEIVSISTNTKITGNLYVNNASGTGAIRINSDASTSSSFSLVACNAVGDSILAVRGDGAVKINNATGYTSEKFWHAGNDGSGSGLNADLLDGVQASSFLRSDATDSASGSLTFSGSTTFNGFSIFNGGVDINSSLTTNGYFRSSSGGNILSYSTNAAWSSSTFGGTLGKSTSSSRRYKENIVETFSENLDPSKILDLSVVQFNYKPGIIGAGDSIEGKTLIGLLAEDVHEKYPVACLYDEEGRPENFYDKVLIPAMLKVIQDLATKVAELESRLI
jgi:hypothetical protein